MDRETLVTFLEKITAQVITDLSQYLKHNPFPLYNYLEFEGSLKSYRFIEKQRPNWTRFFPEFYKFGYNFSKQELLKDFIQEADFPGPKDFIPVHYHAVMQVFANLFADVGPDHFPTGLHAYHNSIQKEADYILRKTKAIKVILLLGNVAVRSEVKSSFFRIYCPTWEERVELYTVAQRNAHFASLGAIKDSGDNIFRSHAFLEFNLELGIRENNIPGKENNEKINRVLKGLRFLHPTPLLIAGRIIGENHHYFNPMFSHRGNGWASQEAEFMRNDLGPMLENFLNSNIQEKFDFIIERTESLSHVPRDHNSRVFDLISICEAILVGTEGELSFKVPLFMTLMTSEFEYKTREERFELFRKCYTLRSKFAHCSEIKDKHQITHEEFQHLSETTLLLRDKLLLLGQDELRKKALQSALS